MLIKAITNWQQLLIRLKSNNVPIYLVNKHFEMKTIKYFYNWKFCLNLFHTFLNMKILNGYTFLQDTPYTQDILHLQFYPHLRLEAEFPALQLTRNYFIDIRTYSWAWRQVYDFFRKKKNKDKRTKMHKNILKIFPIFEKCTPIPENIARMKNFK